MGFIAETTGAVRLQDEPHTSPTAATVAVAAARTSLPDWYESIRKLLEGSDRLGLTWTHWLAKARVPAATRTGGRETRCRTSDHREATHRFCRETELARDAAYLAIHCTDLPATVDRLGERDYRAALVEAGIVEGRLHLAAFTLGHGATGLVFNDDLTPAFLRTHTTGLLATAVGTPAYRATQGGTPRNPTRLRA